MDPEDQTTSKENSPVMLVADDKHIKEELAQWHKIMIDRTERLNDWAAGNKRDARNDKLLYWMFKGPALIGAASTALLEYLGIGVVNLAVGAFVVLLMSVDSLNPRGILYGAHKRAEYEIIALNSKMSLSWERIIVENNQDFTVYRRQFLALLELIQKEEERIMNVLKDAEATLK